LVSASTGHITGFLNAYARKDLLAMIRLDEVPTCICWVHIRGASIPLLAVSFKTNNEIRIYDARGTTEEPIHVIKRLHRKPVIAMVFNNTFDCVISADEGGMLEYWSPNSNYDKPSNVFEMKSSTNLFEFKKVISRVSPKTIGITDKHLVKIISCFYHNISERPTIRYILVSS
jgi:peptidylprolyl isomerase domain and WD repeat-containing protein 1